LFRTQRLRDSTPKRVGKYLAFLFVSSKGINSTEIHVLCHVKVKGKVGPVPNEFKHYAMKA
jgi:hypothetical protein